MRTFLRYRGMTRLRLAAALLLGGVLLASPGNAAVPLEPLHVSNQAPLAGLCGLPSLDRARLLPAGIYEGLLAWDIASNHTDHRRGSEDLLFDGETQRWTLGLNRGLPGGWEIGFELPFLSHSGGFLDGFIEGWHDFFGLPQSGRDQAPRDRLLYLYQRDGEPAIDLDDDAAGLGDVRLKLAYQLFNEADRSLALRASLELPTGSSSDLLGSGSFDAAVWLSGMHSAEPGYGRVALFWGLGLLAADAGDLLPDQRRHLAGLGNLGLAWSPWPILAFQLQLDAHTSLFGDSRLRQIDQFSAQLAMGGALALGERTRLELAVTEDVVVDTAPDVVFHFALTRTF